MARDVNKKPATNSESLTPAKGRVSTAEVGPEKEVAAKTIKAGTSKPSAAKPDDIEGELFRSKEKGITGWVWNRTLPYEALTVELVMGETVLATAQADELDLSLLDRQIGNGKHAFTLQLETWPEASYPASIIVRVAGTKFVVGEVLVRGDHDLVGIVKSAPMGHCDGFIRGALQGWAIDRANPDSPISVDLLDNGVVIATIPCGEYRKDVKESGIGDGYCGFRFELPLSFLDGELHTISVCFSDVQHPLVNGTFMFGVTGPSQLTKQLSAINMRMTKIDGYASELARRHEALITIQRDSIERELQALRRLFMESIAKNAPVEPPIPQARKASAPATRKKSS